MNKFQVKRQTSDWFWPGDSDGFDEKDLIKHGLMEIIAFDLAS